eukprot:PhF_6_TR13248/c1_g1_i1/m.20997
MFDLSPKTAFVSASGLLSLSSLALAIVSLCLPHWVEVQAPGMDNSRGLYQSCGNDTCSSLSTMYRTLICSDNTTLTAGDIETKITVVQAIMYVGCILSLLTLISSVGAGWWQSRYSMGVLVSLITSLLGVGAFTAAVALYGTTTKTWYDCDPSMCPGGMLCLWKYGVSFVLAVVAGGTLVTSFVILGAGYCLLTSKRTLYNPNADAIVPRVSTPKSDEVPTVLPTGVHTSAKPQAHSDVPMTSTAPPKDHNPNPIPTRTSAVTTVRNRKDGEEPSGGVSARNPLIRTPNTQRSENPNQLQQQPPNPPPRDDRSPPQATTATNQVPPPPPAQPAGLNGDWKVDENGLLWSEKEQLYFDTESGQYYDPFRGLWFNSETNEWYELKE